MALLARFADQPSLDGYLGSAAFAQLTRAVSPLVCGGEPNILKLAPIFGA